MLLPVRDFLFAACMSSILVSAQPATAQSADDKATGRTHHELVMCPDSPTPGKRPDNMECAVLAHIRFTELPSGTLFLRLETFSTNERAQAAATAFSVVVEAMGKIWLLTLGNKGQRSEGGTFVNEIGPIPDVPPADGYVLDVAEAAFDFEMRAAVSRAVHTHPGPEIFYIITGEQCLETPAGAMRAGAGEGMVAPANTPMQLNITGSSKRDALFMIVHDSAKPWGMVSDWQPKGLCRH
jgi:quercetin dioxygenase-like cupin family protein